MHFLGIDGGGSGCRAAVCDLTGHILGVGQAGPANIASDPHLARDNVLTATAAALDGGTTNLVDLVCVMGLAGANVPNAVNAFREGLPFQNVQIVSDAVVATKGALQNEDGIVAAIGTGSVFSAQRNGMITQIGGRGLVLGDEGSGAWLGRGLLARALRAADGLEEMTPLLAQTLDDMQGIDGAISFGIAAKPADFAQLAPRITTSDDPAALAFMANATAEINAYISRLQQDHRLPVVFLGGLGSVFGHLLADKWNIKPALGTGVDGAMRLAIQRGG